MVGIDPRRRSGLETLAKVVRETLAGPRPVGRPVPNGADTLELDDDRFTWIAAAVDAGTTSPAEQAPTMSDLSLIHI